MTRFMFDGDDSLPFREFDVVGSPAEQFEHGGVSLIGRPGESVQDRAPFSAFAKFRTAHDL